VEAFDGREWRPLRAAVDAADPEGEAGKPTMGRLY
jgi:hypothetical protein